MPLDIPLQANSVLGSVDREFCITLGMGADARNKMKNENNPSALLIIFLPIEKV